MTRHIYIIKTATKPLTIKTPKILLKKKWMEINNSKKIILDLCGGTGSWSKPYKEAGYDVRNITLPDYDVRTYQPPENVYGILAAPPCTMFSLARTRAIKPRDFNEGMEIVEACLKIIFDIRKKQKLAFWALENPMGYLRQFLGKPPFHFDPWEFGEPYTKGTDIWGYFNFPEKQYKVMTEVMTEEQILKCKTNSRKLPPITDITGSKQVAKRAITPKGLAEAFFKVNK
jgi:hypothetical protein